MKLKMILLAAGAVFVAANVQAKPLQYTNVEQNVVVSVVADDYEAFMRGGNSFIADGVKNVSQWLTATVYVCGSTRRALKAGTCACLTQAALPTSRLGDGRK